MSYDNPAAIITSAAGAQVGIISDGVSNRLQVETRNATGCSVSQTAQGCGSVAKSVIAQMVSGTTTDLQVNGATTSVVFSYPAQSTNVTIFAIRLFMSALSFSFAGNSFGGGTAAALGSVTYAPALTKGLQFGAKSGGVTYNLFKYLVNEDFLCANGGGSVGSTANSAILSSTLLCNQTLIGGSTDAITATVQDNQTNRNISVLRAYVYGVSS